MKCIRGTQWDESWGCQEWGFSSHADPSLVMESTLQGRAVRSLQRAKKKKTFGIMEVHPLLHGWHGSGLTEEQKNERKARQCWAATKRRQNGAAEGLSIFPWGCSAAAGISQLSSSGAQTEAVNFIWSR